ncbi:MAG: DUF4367 domain-containing protein [Clostridia bacterium]|nr:DUF4367 domain-containing protein [Clostridia bacterium]
MFEAGKEDISKMIFKEYNNRLCTQLPTDEELKDITFSKRFLKNAERMINHYDKFYYVFINTLPKRIACFVMMSIILLTLVACSIKPLREVFTEFIVETYENFTEIVFSEKDVIERENNSFSSKFPTYIPKAFSLISSVETDSFNKQIYSTNSNEILTFIQSFKDRANLRINTENIDYERMELSNGYEALFYTNMGENSLIYMDDTYIFTITISNPYPKEELIQIFESIK